ncbi:hypothetical protein BRADI_2g47436v3, partial [Brachypodium distachyon]
MPSAASDPSYFGKPAPCLAQRRRPPALLPRAAPSSPIPMLSAASLLPRAPSSFPMRTAPSAQCPMGNGIGLLLESSCSRASPPAIDAPGKGRGGGGAPRRSPSRTRQAGRPAGRGAGPRRTLPRRRSGATPAKKRRAWPGARGRRRGYRGSREAAARVRQE